MEFSDYLIDGDLEMEENLLKGVDEDQDEDNLYVYYDEHNYDLNLNPIRLGIS